ncbi:hypothetical protein CBS63078_189 [Aspergillus niger]|nr:hypothetical protein CBS115989_940 [Aspergillus niger]KAI2826686.1 hypothetical protein CBS133816_7191 [Aspergillus niger]KAI2834576.1 hypothetical protein CBS11232_10780 [Aspergillus niger]KAI2852376.1 hypothetical protein CBS11350_854 [Aspergillus niger]KAI2863018.1 hypothetical protein CBS12448_4231 [Aspergillus niger]
MTSTSQFPHFPHHLGLRCCTSLLPSPLNSRTLGERRVHVPSIASHKSNTTKDVPTGKATTTSQCNSLTTYLNSD